MKRNLLVIYNQGKNIYELTIPLNVGGHTDQKGKLKRLSFTPLLKKD